MPEVILQHFFLFSYLLLFLISRLNEHEKKVGFVKF